jgi:hypothetical protein
MSKGHLDVAASGAFLSLTTDGATALIKKIVANQGWGEDRTPAKTQKDMHTMKEMDMLATKIDLLLKKFDERATEVPQGTIKTMDSQMTCEVCGNVGHLGNDCLEIHEEASYINNGYHQQGGNNNGWNNLSHPPFQGNSNFNSNYNSNQPSLKDLVLGQAKINENLTKKLLNNDKILENINLKIEGLSSSIRNQLSFNKMIETQMAQIAAEIPRDNDGKTLGQPVNVLENFKVVTTRGVKSTRDPPNPSNPNHAARKQKDSQEEPSTSTKTQKDSKEETVPLEYTDTMYLPFPTRTRK